MINNLRLRNFKNFQDADLHFGPFTVLIGANASGKSNLRDAFHFLNGISRGYTLADVFGEKYTEGVLQWRGIRGGTREIVYRNEETFSLEVTFSPLHALIEFETLRYRIDVQVEKNGTGTRVVRESLYDEKQMLFDSHPKRNPPHQQDRQHLTVKIKAGGDFKRGHVETLLSNRPVLTQLKDLKRLTERFDENGEWVKLAIEHTISVLASMRFLDLNPSVMRQPSFPGQTTLGDRGENLASVLQDICEDEKKKKALLEWIQVLTPMDAQNLDFQTDITGRITLVLIEKDGLKTSAYSASDGTLRFLALLAALLGRDTSRFYFLEELENGIHPTRLHLLVNLIEQQTSRVGFAFFDLAPQKQVVASTHSPQLLRLLSRASLEDASLIYRLEDHPEARAVRLRDIPEASTMIARRDPAELHESGWFEDIMFFTSEKDEGEEVAE